MMSKILILFASLTGNTEYMADIISDELIHLEHDVDLKAFDVDYIEVEEICEYDAVLVGTYTWDDGSLPYEVEDFYDDLEEANIKDKIFAVFGSADSFYPVYGGAIDLIGDRAQDLGAKVLPERLKIELELNDEDIEKCRRFAAMVDEVLHLKV